MDIKLWYSKHTKQWRWSLIDPVTRKQESGQQWDLRDAMSDVAILIKAVDKLGNSSASENIVYTNISGLQYYINKATYTE